MRIEEIKKENILKFAEFEKQVTKIKDFVNNCYKISDTEAVEPKKDLDSTILDIGMDIDKEIERLEQLEKEEEEKLKASQE